MSTILWSTMETPKPFGLFHLVFFSLIIIVLTLLLLFYRNCPENKFRRIILCTWILMVVLELTKQVIFNYHPDTHEWSRYNYSSFPFQFCSLPFYIYPLLVFLPDGKFRNLLLTFSVSFIFFGGFGYFFFPVSFCEYVVINLQTMIHHGAQVVLGIFIFVHEFDKMHYKNVLKSTSVLVVAILIAIALNLLFSVVAQYPDSVNMFELSPVNKTSAPVFSDILNATNYPTFVLIYIVGFLGFASLSYFGMRYATILVSHFSTEKASKKELTIES